MVIVTLFVQGECVLEAGASASLYADPQADDVALGTLAGHELGNLLRSYVGELNHLPRLYRRWRRYSELPVPTEEELRERIEQALPGAEVSVQDTTGGGDHFRAEVVSDRFEGLSRIQQHKLIYDVFGEDVGGAIHALSIKTQTPGEGR
jgi:stress-induced morphogen